MAGTGHEPHGMGDNQSDEANEAADSYRRCGSQRGDYENQASDSARS